MGRRALAAMLMVIAALLLLPMPAAHAADPSADLVIHTGSDTVGISTLGTVDYTIVIHNSGEDTYVLTPVFSTDCTHISSSLTVNGTAVPSGEAVPFTLGPGSNMSVTVSMTGTKYLENGSFTGSLSLYPYVSDGSQSWDPIHQTFAISATSMISDATEYNLILGTFRNPLPSPFDGAVVSAAISLILWAAIAAVAAFVSVRAAGRIIIRSSKKRNEAEQENYSKLRTMWRSVFAIVMIVGIMQCFNILGLEENLVVVLDDVLTVMLVAFLSLTAWGLYRAFVVEMGIRQTKDRDYGSLIPLMLMLGRIAILFGAAVVILAVFGIDLVSIIAGLGLAATAISIGASNIISQFLSGMVLLIERPFTAGDKIKVGADTTELVVQKVRVMNTRLKNWNNEEYYLIPNSTLTDGEVVNITKDNLSYKVYDYYSIAYDSDIARAKQILVDCALEHEGVVTDGTFSVPDVKFMGVDRSGISLRLAYVVADHENSGIFAAQIREAAYKRFNEEGIEIPFSQYTVNVCRTEDGDPDGM